MKILLAPDSFKGSLSQKEACDAMHTAIRAALPNAEVIDFPLSDGGDGFAAVLRHHCDGKRVTVQVKDPLGRPVVGEYLVIESGEVIIEVASACGLQLLDKKELDPLSASSFGAGQLIKAAIQDGYRRLIIGLGGSATNDGGSGLLAALGFDLLDEEGAQIVDGAEGLMRLHEIDSSHVIAALGETEIVLASDVQNLMLGEAGASRVFGPQKGASQDVVEILESALSRFNDVIIATTGQSMADIPGAGAAGGIGAALMAFTSATYRSGFDVVVELTGLERLLSEEKPDLLITCEGRLDKQTLNGKLPLGVSRLAGKYAVPVAVIAGQVELSAYEQGEMGFLHAESLCQGSVGVEEATRNASTHLYAATQRLLKVYLEQTDKRG